MKKQMKEFVFSRTHIDIWNDNGRNREAWLEKTLAKIPAGKTLLDAGAGELQYKKFCEHLDYTSQDFGGYDGQGNAEGFQTKTWDNTKLDIVSDIIDIPVENASFDSILCVEVFEHIPQPALAVKEFSRILKPGGALIVTAPFCSLTHFAPFYFANGYSKYWYEKVLTENGFEIEEMDFNGNYFTYMAQELRRLPFMVNNYHKKDVSFIKKIGRVISMFFLKLFIAPLFLLLYIFSKNDVSSNQILCFGIHVVAKKK
ncbi:MAG: class I SAM-dependent methyltransferase [Candidatus Paceibacterota bacterium]